MDTYIAWAIETRRTTNGQRVEHVSFPSFVKNFRLTDQRGALADYAELLTASEISEKRRQVLQSTHATFMKNRLQSFWKVWEAQEKLDTSSEVTAKETAVLAQEASLHESKKSYGAL
ncbi:hypothetical protein BGZ76_007036, partial [Entomortierella beljakovae]